MSARRRLLPILTLVVSSHAALGQNERLATRTPVRHEVQGAQVQAGKVILQLRGRVLPLPSGTFVNESGVTLMISDGVITQLAAPAGTHLTLFLDGTERRTDRVLQTSWRISFQAANVGSDGSIRLQTKTGDVYVPPDGAYKRVNSGQEEVVLLWCGGKPCTLVL